MSALLPRVVHVVFLVVTVARLSAHSSSASYFSACSQSSRALVVHEEQFWDMAAWCWVLARASACSPSTEVAMRSRPQVGSRSMSHEVGVQTLVSATVAASSRRAHAPSAPAFAASQLPVLARIACSRSTAHFSLVTTSSRSSVRHRTSWPSSWSAWALAALAAAVVEARSCTLAVRRSWVVLNSLRISPSICSFTTGISVSVMATLASGARAALASSWARSCRALSRCHRGTPASVAMGPLTCSRAAKTVATRVSCMASAVW
mmetsp:Transcript_42459/g.92632  ORF Transcript_42459/g.92632 Transcript_42459/m.92632 type:complete len:263 (+) Transcript_42459:1572-2360(+)